MSVTARPVSTRPTVTIWSTNTIVPVFQAGKETRVMWVSVYFPQATISKYKRIVSTDIIRVIIVTM